MRHPASSLALSTFALGAAILGAAVLGAPTARAAQSDPAASQIETFDQALVETMKHGPALGAKGRYRKLAPAIEHAFNLPLMTRVAVGPAWTTMSQADHQALVEGFTRLSVASYAHNFNSYAGERLEVDPLSQVRGSDRIVQSHIIPAHGAPVALTYRMRDDAGSWKIIDVIYSGISQLTTRRSDFTAPLAAGGAKGLAAHLEALSDKLLR